MYIFLWLKIPDLKLLAVFCPPSPLFRPQGIRARILETLVMLILLALLILGIVWVASALIDNDAASMESLYGMKSEKQQTQHTSVILNTKMGIFI